jgi:FkbH-like protein
MSNHPFADLAWLPSAPADFNERCRALGNDGDKALASEVRELGGLRMNESQLVKFARAMTRLQSGNVSLPFLDDFRMGLLSNGTSDFLSPVLIASAVRHGISLRLCRGDYGQVIQEACSPHSAINSPGTNAVLVALDYRWFPFEACPGEPEQAEKNVALCVAQLKMVCDGIKSHTGAVCIVQTLAAPVETFFGNLDRGLPGTLQHLIERFNTEVRAWVANTGDLLFDVAALSQTVGLVNWFDLTAWDLAKVPFSHEFLPLYGDHVGRLLGALRGKSRRCLILDLDNTVWGGVIGDDGLAGIKIAQGDATGEAHLNVQRTALALRRRGVVLAVSSKNTDEVARKPFLEHPEMLLKLDDIAVFQANWRDKATNIQAIADELALGLQSMVFLDDNPMERDLVRRMLPEVAVPELPSDPALFARTLLAAGYFESARFLPEDAVRADLYQQNSRRVELQAAAGDLNSYLQSLQMVITFRPFDDTGRARIVQLISKSNQFNLTTRRYSESDVAGIQQDPDAFAMQVRLADIFGDNGMISVIICRPAGEQTLEIDTWLMSCRVLGRQVEEAVLLQILEYARNRGYRKVLGRYIPTPKNGLVQDHYQKLGFDKVDQLQDGTTVWELPVEYASIAAPPMTFA